MKPAVAYFRVSTDRQGISGLGTEAQKDSVDTFCKSQDYQIIRDFTEVESGKKSDRPKLLEALKLCKKEKATLIIAKLDRLSRNVGFIANLMDSKVKFIAADNPGANELMVHLLSAFAQHERKAIGTRTKDALQAAKRRGVKLGSPKINELSQKNKESAKLFAKNMAPVITRMKEEGVTTVRGIAHQLNTRKIPTYRGGSNAWHNQSVCRLLKLID